uniref:Tetraspanin-9 n=3 Tax=Catarrhini TaxID=9526 RepID=A0A7N9CB22_MACFA
EAIAPLHSCLGNRVRPCLKKKQNKTKQNQKNKKHIKSRPEKAPGQTCLAGVSPASAHPCRTPYPVPTLGGRQLLGRRGSFCKRCLRQALSASHTARPEHRGRGSQESGVGGEARQPGESERAEAWARTALGCRVGSEPRRAHRQAQTFPPLPWEEARSPQGEGVIRAPGRSCRSGRAGGGAGRDGGFRNPQRAPAPRGPCAPSPGSPSFNAGDPAWGGAGHWRWRPPRPGAPSPPRPPRPTLPPLPSHPPHPSLPPLPRAAPPRAAPPAGAPFPGRPRPRFRWRRRRCRSVRGAGTHESCGRGISWNLLLFVSSQGVCRKFRENRYHQKSWPGCSSSFIHLPIHSFSSAIEQLLCGCGLLGVGIWLSVSQGNFATFSPSFPSLSAANLVIAIGTIVMVTGFLGCLGAIKENKCLLLSFFIVLLVILLAELILLILFFVYMDKVNENAKKDLKEGLLLYHTENNVGLKNAWNIIQAEMRCCGVTDYTDWYPVLGENTVPDRCCMENSQGCGRNATTPLWRTGCYEKVKMWFDDNKHVLGTVGMCILIMQILGMAFSMTLFQHIHRTGKKYDA